MEDISLHIIDIAENSVAAGAALVWISIIMEPEKDLFTLLIEDDGRGMPEEFVVKALDPFCTTRTTRKIGMGLSLLAQSARETGGDIMVHSVPNEGTTVTAVFKPSHIDMKPLGSIADTITALIAGNPHTDFRFSCCKGSRDCHLDTRELRSVLEEVPVNSAEVLAAIRDDLRDALDDILKP